MNFYTDPFFWALVSIVGIHGAALVVIGHRLGRNLPFVSLMLTLVTLGRVLLVLPFCPQPRLDLGGWSWTLGVVFLLLALVFGAPTLTIRWWCAPQGGMELRTSGVYAITRNPMYLAEILWPLGWAILWGSMYGMALTVVWWYAFLTHVLLEETRLEAALGEDYVAYKNKVRGRLIPGLPV